MKSSQICSIFIAILDVKVLYAVFPHSIYIYRSNTVFPILIAFRAKKIYNLSNMRLFIDISFGHRFQTSNPTYFLSEQKKKCMDGNQSINQQ